MHIKVITHRSAQVYAFYDFCPHSCLCKSFECNLAVLVFFLHRYTLKKSGSVLKTNLDFWRVRQTDFDIWECLEDGLRFLAVSC